MKKPIILKSTTFSRFLSKSMTLLILFIVFSSAALMAQKQSDILVSGIVTDPQGETLIGVSVQIKGSGKGTVTDIDGKFSLRVPSEKSVLQFSYIGYKPTMKVVGKDRILKIMMDSGDKSLEDVVVVGYGYVKKKDLTGSVSRVNMEDLEKAPVKSVDEALGGRIAGVQVTSGDGQPGSNTEIIVRGVGSVTQSSSPLYVIDGFPQESANFNSINPSDIESIEVLKDASSTAIYGARGSNGVIIISTKRGKSEKPIITYNGYIGGQQAIKSTSLMGGYEFARLENDINPAYTDANYFVSGMTLEDYKSVKGIDWQNKVFNQLPIFQNHSISVSGKTNKVAYTVSGSYLDQKGLIIKTGFSRFQGRVTLDMDITDNLKVGLNTNYSNSVTTGQTGNASQGNYFSFMYNLWSYRPLLSGGVSESNYENYIYNDLIDDAASSTQLNPYIATLNAYNVRNSTSLTPNAYILYKITKDLSFRSTIGISVNSDENLSFNNSNTFDGNPYTGFGKTWGVNGSRSVYSTNNLLNENTLTFNKKINVNNTINAVIGFTDQQFTEQRYDYRIVKLPMESLGVNGFGFGTPYSESSYASLYNIASFLGRVNYNLYDKYLFTASIRADGCSKFAPENKWGYFPSGAVAWRISQEPLLKDFSQLDNAKLRISYGATGNNRVDNFAYMTMLSMTNSSSTSNSSIVPFGSSNYYVTSLDNLLGNKNLKWETGIQTDIGLDLSFFKSRLNIELDYYNRTTKDLLIKATMPAFSGFTQGWENVGKVSNSGIELSINTVNIQTKKFVWRSSFNITFNQNRLMSLNSGLNQITSTMSMLGRTSSIPTYISKVGAPVGMFYGFISDGVYQLGDFYRLQNGASGYSYALKEGIPAPRAGLRYYISDAVATSTTDPTGKSVQPGDLKYKDLNGDGLIDINDATVIGNPYPIHFGGLTNTFSFMNFDLSIFLQWSYGNQILNANRIFSEGTWGGQGTSNPVTASGMLLLNQFDTYSNRWTLTNASNLYPRVDQAAETARYVSSRLIEDGSYLRVKTVQISYNIPAKIVKSIRLTSARFYISGQNLFTITGYSGIDPEVTTARAGNMYTTGFDLSPYPRTKVITLGTSITL